MSLKDIWELLVDIHEKTADTPLESVFPILIVLALFYISFRFVLIPVCKGIKKLYDYFLKKHFIKTKVYHNLSFMEASDIYYAINQYIPTRFSIKDSRYEEEPVPEYTVVDGEKEQLLLERFLKYEYSIKNGRKYYLCLGDCGMGKTTFLINLYYWTLRQHKYKCEFVPLQESGHIEKIEKIEKKEETILLLDALDENKDALQNYQKFITELVNATCDFYRVIITARTNFFTNELEEHLPDIRKNSGTTGKLSDFRKFYITPFTDEDIQRFLKVRYRLDYKKRKKAWNIVEKNKNLSVRPMLLRFMDDIIEEAQEFSYDFQLYECLFRKWIEREKGSLKGEKGKKLYQECLFMAKAIYEQWLKNGQIGIKSEELDNEKITETLSIQLKGHALLNRYSDGRYKFSHKSYWEFLLAKLALTDLYFSESLLIKNFDRAASFLEEMIQYGKLSEETEDTNAAIGTANYILKYKKPEDAEVIYLRVLKESTLDWEHRVFALNKLARCFYQQMKFQSMRYTLDEVKDLLLNVELNRDTLLLYVMYGYVEAAYCKKFELIAGQEFLERVIRFCKENQLFGYYLLQCYERYCYCCVNYKLNQDAVAQMEKLIVQRFQDDQYAYYLLISAKSWKISYSDTELGQLLKIQENYKHFMDVYDYIMLKCDLGVCIGSYNVGVLSNYDDWNELGVDYFADAFDAYDAIYDEDSFLPIKSIYYAQIERKLVIGFKSVNYSMQAANIEHIITYINDYNLNDEMSIVLLEMYGRISKNMEYSFAVRKDALLKRCALARNNEYELIDTYWDLYLLYDENDADADVAQVYLRDAYEIAMNSPGYHNRPSYCYLLQVVLDYYDNAINKKEIAQELVRITPKIFGTDKRRKRIYSSLKRYFTLIQSSQLVYVCLELLRCDFSCNLITDFYNSCIDYKNEKAFLAGIHNILKEKEDFTQDEIKELEKFLEPEKKNGLNSSEVENSRGKSVKKVALTSEVKEELEVLLNNIMKRSEKIFFLDRLWK